MRTTFERGNKTFAVKIESYGTETVGCKFIEQEDGLCTVGKPFELSYPEIEQIHSTCGAILQDRARSLELSDEAKAFKENPTMDSVLAIIKANETTKG
jgi:hypothetical protein